MTTAADRSSSQNDRRTHTSHAPIAVFAYRRPDLLQRMFMSLRACLGFAQSSVTIFVDGPRTPADLPAVQAVRDFAYGLRLSNVEVVVRDENLGLPRSIVAGARQLCARDGRVIVLEDDLLLSPHALDYFNLGLESFKNERRVWSICSYMYDVPELRLRTEAMALPLAHPWGWATWERSLAAFDLDAPIDPLDLESASFRTSFNLSGFRDFTAMLQLSVDGKISSWFIRWYYQIFKSDGLSIFPPQSFSRNIGISGSGGTHASVLNPYNFLVPPAPLATHPVRMPNSMQVDYAAIDEMNLSRGATVQRFIDRLGRIKRRLR